MSSVGIKAELKPLILISGAIPPARSEKLITFSSISSELGNIEDEVEVFSYFSPSFRDLVFNSSLAFCEYLPLTVEVFVFIFASTPVFGTSVVRVITVETSAFLEGLPTIVVGGR